MGFEPRSLCNHCLLDLYTILSILQILCVINKLTILVLSLSLVLQVRKLRFREGEPSQCHPDQVTAHFVRITKKNCPLLWAIVVQSLGACLDD